MTAAGLEDSVIKMRNQVSGGDQDASSGKGSNF